MAMDAFAKSTARDGIAREVRYQKFHAAADRAWMLTGDSKVLGAEMARGGLVLRTRGAWEVRGVISPLARGPPDGRRRTGPR